MDEVLQEFVTSRGVEMRVDRVQGVLRGVKLLGLASRNGRKYLPAALSQAAPLYEGAKVNVNHPKGNPLAARDYQDRLGSIRNVSLRSDGLFGDLHFNPKHALAEQLLWDAAHAPENVGFSHNVEARTARQGSETVVEAILKVQSVDLVADPATTDGLYESAGAEANATRWRQFSAALAAATPEELRAVRPDLFPALTSGQQNSAERIALLECEVERLQGCLLEHERRVTATRLLEEFHLPHPAHEATGGALVSELFFETLLAAADEDAMRALVRERAATIEAARAQFPAAAVRPLSREQGRVEARGAVYDARSFARAISR